MDDHGRSSTTQPIFYVLDTNVLIHDPNALLNFQEHHVAIPMTVLEELDKLNCIALDREICLAREQADGRGLVAVNVMKAVGAHGQHVRQACESGADAIVMGAGLPLDLPEMTADYPNVALIPILSDSRGINVVMKRWMRKGRLPDAIVIEHPNLAGGHLGAPRIEDLNDPKFSFERVLAETRALFDELQVADKVPLIVAGGKIGRAHV